MQKRVLQNAKSERKHKRKPCHAVILRKIAIDDRNLHVQQNPCGIHVEIAQLGKRCYNSRCNSCHNEGEICTTHALNQSFSADSA